MGPIARPSFSPEFQISGRLLSRTGQGVFFIAEAGVAHFGSFDMAQQLFALARDAGADAFKLQVFDVNEMLAARASEWRNRLKDRVLTFEQVAALRRQCADAGMAFILTAHDESKIEWLEKLEVDAVKVGSGERRNLRFIQRLCRLGRPVIISTGMYDRADVQAVLDAVAEAGCRDLALLHCVTSYPTPPEQVNLAAMDTLREMYPGPYGYSDHTTDGLAVLGAVARGATVIEKHITIQRDIPNAQDWKVSADPTTLGPLVRDLQQMRRSVGSGEKIPAPCETPAQTWALKSLVAGRALAKGHLLEDQDIKAKRPGDGIPPDRLPELIGRRLERPLEEDELLRWEDLS
jgi:N,N'-diacetyllegionaminate synthase